MPTHYAVVSVAEPERHVHVLPTGSEAGIIAGQLNQQMRDQDNAERYRVVPVTVDDPTEPDWRQREQARFDTGTYTPVPWANEPWAAELRDHFAHVSVEDRSMISFTHGEDAGREDRQTRMSPGRYLARYRGDRLSAIEIRRWRARWSIAHEGLVLGFATTEDEIEQVYLTGPRSCMSHPARNYSTRGYHPTRVYAAGDLAIAYLGTPADGVSARCLCWPERRIYGRIYDGGDGRLATLLENEGYRRGDRHENWNGARFLLRRVGQTNRIVIPYLDAPNFAVRVDLEAGVARLDNGGGTYGQSTDGTVAFAFPVQQPTAALSTGTLPNDGRHVTAAEINRRTPRQWTISYVQSWNPRIHGTRGWRSFQLYRAGMTVGEYLALSGAGTDHLRWDVDHGFIRVTATP